MDAVILTHHSSGKWQSYVFCSKWHYITNICQQRTLSSAHSQGGMLFFFHCLLKSLSGGADYHSIFFSLQEPLLVPRLRIRIKLYPNSASVAFTQMAKWNICAWKGSVNGASVTINMATFDSNWGSVTDSSSVQIKKHTFEHTSTNKDKNVHFILTHYFDSSYSSDGTTDESH